MYWDSSLSHFLYLELIQKRGGGAEPSAANFFLRNSEPGGRPDSKEGRGGEAVEAFLKEAQLIRNYPVYKFSGDDKALDLVWRDH